MNGSSDWFRNAVSMRGFNTMYPRSKRVASAQKVIWLTDERGNGLCVSKDKELSEWMMQNYGMDGVAYAYGEPDLEPFVETITPEKLTDAAFAQYRQKEHGLNTEPVVCTATEGVRCQFHTDDTISVKREVNKDYCIDRIVETMGGNVDKQVVEDYFAYRGLTCHEPSDLHTLQIVPSCINREFAHTAGISTARHSEEFMNLPLQESEGEGMKVLRRGMGDSPYRHHSNTYAEVYDSFALPIDTLLTPEALLDIYQQDVDYTSQLHQYYGDGFAPRDNGATESYATLATQLQDGYRRASTGIAESDGAKYIEGIDRYNTAHQQVNTDYYTTTMMLMQDREMDNLYGLNQEDGVTYASETSYGQGAEQSTDQLYGSSTGADEAPMQDVSQEQSTDQLYRLSAGVDEAPAQDVAQEQSTDQLYGISAGADEAPSQDVSQEQSADQLYGATPQQNENPTVVIGPAIEEPDLDIGNDLTY